jgi:hypothetical protein
MRSGVGIDPVVRQSLVWAQLGEKLALRLEPIGI